MLDLQKNRSTLIYGAAAVSLAILGTSITYYILEDDKRAKRRKEARKAERATLRILQQIKEQQEKIEASMKSSEDTIEDQSCTDKDFRKKEYTLAHANELLLQLMEKLDAIRPLTVVLGGDIEKEPTEFENQLVSNIKSKKRNIIEAIEGLFRRLDTANVKAKKEASRREQVAKEKARIEQEQKKLELEEAERKLKMEQEQEKIRLEQEQKAKEEAERVAKEEAERRLKEEELAKLALEAEAIQKLSEQQHNDVTVQEEAVLAALKEVEQHEEK
ncbi:hypothetical protein BDF21DRAFT_428984 [Thamnidium elegans]|uniref:Uncharacterized protein n=1 Tax=Thamnidium elegans TaxID=101142 RepID=A0A8H7SUZ3_9FUNG|nr:hypothetical protein INT48_000536 [Thamnidium elegans]KAI8062030.1 hypothetical protein BDF21DRAFT_428984 [Thamnidium elegans]